jgi:hypothetical protein
MPRRVEYFDDPNAPRANSLVVAVTAIVTNDHGQLLLQNARTTSSGGYQVAP